MTKLPAGTFHVDWKLLDGMNHSCPYSSEPPAAAKETYTAEPILEAAYSLLAMNRPLYIVRLYGGEPTIHPFLQDLWRYLMTSGRDTRFILHTNGLRSLNYYERLFNNGSAHIHILFNAHPQHIKANKLVSLINVAHDAGLSCQVNLNYVQEYGRQAGEIAASLAALRKLRPFGFKLYAPMGESAPWFEDVRNIFSTINSPDNIPDWAETSKAHSGGRFFCHGVNAAHVTPEGKLTLGLAHGDLPFAPYVGEDSNVLPGMPEPEGFESREEAENWLKNASARNLKYLLDRAPVRHPLHNSLSRSQALQARFAAVNSYDTEGINGNPAIWHERQQDIIKILDFLEDDESAAIFIALAKACAIGDLSNNPPDRGADFEIEPLVFEDEDSLDEGEKTFAESDNADSVEEEYKLAESSADETGVGARSEIEKDILKNTQDRLDEYPPDEKVIQHFDNISAFQKKLPFIKWYHCSFELEVDQGSGLIDLLLSVQTQFPGYKFRLRKDRQRIFLLAENLVGHMQKQTAARSADRLPLSIIIHAAGTIPVFSKTLESAQEAAGEDGEIIVIIDSSAPWLGIVADKAAINQPWNTRVFHIEKKLDTGMAWNAGIRLASGKYLYFLRSGEVLDSKSLACGLQDSNNADICVLSQNIAEIEIYEGADVSGKYLEGNAENASAIFQGGILYRRQLINQYRLVFPEGSRFGDDVFNLCAFLLAQKTVYLPCKYNFASRFEEISEAELESAIDKCSFILRQIARARRFFAAHGTVNQQHMRTWTQNQLTRSWDILSAGFAEAFQKGQLEILLTEDILADIAAQTEFIDILSQKLARTSPFIPELAPAAYDAAASPRYEIAGKMAQSGKTWPLAIITTIECDELAEWTPAGSCDQVEHVLVVHGADSNPSSRLAMLMDMYPNISAIGIEDNSSLAAGLNMALKLAHGEAITFFTGSDIVAQDFIAQTANALNTMPADIHIFEYGKENVDGSIEQHCHENGIFPGIEALGKLLLAGVEPGLEGAVFKKGHLLTNGVTFNPNASHDSNSQLFLAKAVKNASVRFVPLPAMRRRHSTAQSAASQTDFVELCELYSILDQYAQSWPPNYRKAYDKWLAAGINTRWLPLARLAGPDVCVPDLSSHFLAILISEYARLLADPELDLERE